MCCGDVWGLATDVEKGDVEGRYQKAYEERINPFGDFRDKEKAARKQKMHVADRVMYEFGQIISGSQCVSLRHLPSAFPILLCVSVVGQIV